MRELDRTWYYPTFDGYLTSLASRRKISEIWEKCPFPHKARPSKLMTPGQPSQSSQKKVHPEQCKHPRVQIVSRDEDSEYVECQECGDVFESSEFKDMAIEEKKKVEEE